MLIKDKPKRAIAADTTRHGLNFIKLDGDIGCLGMRDNRMSTFLH